MSGELAPETLCHLLESAIIHGARAADLMLQAPALVDCLYPASVHPSASLGERAVLTETLIRTVTSQLDPEMGAFLEILLGLAPGSVRKTLTVRYEKAGRVFGVTGRVARERRHKHRVLMHLAVALYQRATAREAAA